MKSLYIVRHAKSSWDNIALPDFERTLNERGKKDAPEMAKRLLERKIKIDAFVSSPAKRAKKTAKLFIEAFGSDEDKIILVENLYHASGETFYEVISGLEDSNKHVALFSHNPGITDFVNTLCDGVRIDNMPTCAVFAIEIDTKKWSEFRTANKKFLFFDYPKRT
jgi:phosphohistidine phosphatase